MRRRIPLIIAIAAAWLLVPAITSAALIDEQHQGQNLIAELSAGTKRCSDLSADDFDHVGEYVMFKALGSTSLHQAMNDRMTLMMGEQAETRMHQLLGVRYAGCSSRGLGIPGYGSMMGGGNMMGGYYNSGGWGAMMSSGDWSWMRAGAWQHMSRQDWSQLRQRLLGTGMMNGHTGWSAVAIVGAALAGVVLVGLVILAIARRWPFRRPPAAAPSS